MTAERRPIWWGLGRFSTRERSEEKTSLVVFVEVSMVMGTFFGIAHIRPRAFAGKRFCWHCQL